MNAREYALNDIRRRIPAQILDMGLSQGNSVSPNLRWVKRNKIESLDARLITEILEDIVNVDCNLKGATQITIDLAGVPFDQVNGTDHIYYIPYDKTNGLRIVSVQSLNYMKYNDQIRNNSTGHGGNMLLSAGMDMYNSSKTIPVTSTSNCTVMGNNVILCRDSVSHVSASMSMTVTLENAEAMANLNRGAYKHYAKLAELATKAYIYNKLSITLDKGALHAGMDLGKIREIIDSYSDAQDMYDEYYEENWGKVAFTNDRPRMHEYIASMLGRGS